MLLKTLAAHMCLECLRVPNPAVSNLGPSAPAGNSKGSTFVFDATTGCQVCRADAIRVEGPVRSCGLSEDCRHLLAVVGNGFIFRFEYRSQELAGAGE